MRPLLVWKHRSAISKRVCFASRLARELEEFAVRTLRMQIARVEPSKTAFITLSRYNKWYDLVIIALWFKVYIGKKDERYIFVIN